MISINISDNAKMKKEKSNLKLFIYKRRVKGARGGTFENNL
jgi:hypothetical protein